MKEQHICFQYTLRASYIELYNEEIRDLTKGPNGQEKHEIKYPPGEQGKATITNIKEEEVENTDDVRIFKPIYGTFKHIH